MLEVFDFYAALVESSDDAIIAKDPRGVVVAWNPAAERLFGYSAEEMVGESIRNLLPDSRQEEEDRILKMISAGERVAKLRTQRCHKDGRLLDVEVTVSPVRDSNGTVVGASKIARDVGPDIAKEKLLRESEQRFHMLADNIAPFVWIARPDGHIFWYNKRWYEYTGTTLEEMEGWGWKKVHHPEHVDRVESHFRESLEKGEQWEDTFPLRGTKGEYRWYLSRAKPIRDDDGQILYWFGTNTDITEEREQAEQIRVLLMEVNHRAKNMLGTVQALARRTARGDTDFVKRFEQRIRSLSVNQDILVQRQWRQVPVRELIMRQLAFLEGSTGEMTVEGPDCAITPRAAEVIGMALHELATNALKYGALSAEGGKVRIGWSISESGGLEMEWRETGGPAVRKPESRGFGTTLICDIPVRSLGADADLSFSAEGVSWTLACDSRVLAGDLAAAAE